MPQVHAPAHPGKNRINHPAAAPLPAERRAPSLAQELEFIIHPDGRVEERVRGVKGVDCQSLTEEINKALGEVYESKPTQEMFEQKVEVNVEAEATVSESWTGSGSVRSPPRPAPTADSPRSHVACVDSLCTVGQQRRQRQRRQLVVDALRCYGGCIRMPTEWSGGHANSASAVSIHPVSPVRAAGRVTCARAVWPGVGLAHHDPLSMRCFY